MTENGVEIDKIVSKTVDGGISELILAEKVVTVFHELKGAEEGDGLHEEEVKDKPLVGEIGNMVDDNGILKDDVDQDFHETSDGVESSDRVSEEVAENLDDGVVSELQVGHKDIDSELKNAESEEVNRGSEEEVMKIPGGDSLDRISTKDVLEMADSGRVDGASSEEVTKTADGAVSELKLVDNVVQVFHEPNVTVGGDSFENKDGHYSEESKEIVDDGSVGTQADSGSLDDNVDEEFHESNDGVESSNRVSEEEVAGNLDNGAVSELVVGHEDIDSELKNVGGEEVNRGSEEEVIKILGGESLDRVRTEGAAEMADGETVGRASSEEVTKTADGAISELKLLDNVVQVFHEPKISIGGDGFENEDGHISTESKEVVNDGSSETQVIENDAKDLTESVVEDVVDSRDQSSLTEVTKTVDGAISMLNIVDNVVQVFHESKGSDVDDVFEKLQESEEVLKKDDLQTNDLKMDEILDSNDDERLSSQSPVTNGSVGASSGVEDPKDKQTPEGQQKSFFAPFEQSFKPDLTRAAEVLKEDDVETTDLKMDEIFDSIDERLSSQSPVTNGSVGASSGAEGPKDRQTHEGQQKSVFAPLEQPFKPDLTGTREVQRAVQPAVQPSQSTLPSRPAGLGRGAPLLEPSRTSQQARVNGAAPQRQAQLVEDSMNGEAEENDETREKLQNIRVKFLRLAHRLGQTPHNVVVAQVLYRLGLAEQLRGRNTGRVGAFSFDRASAKAEQLEAANQEPLDFACTIMVIGKTGVGKSATINSIFDEVKFSTHAFEMGTKKVQDVVGTVQGIKVRVIDTPGLLPCSADQRHNEKILHSVKKFIQKTPPDIVLYLDRLDMQSRDFGDMPLLRTITEIFGPSIWFNAIVVLTHAASAPPDGPNGIPSSYEMFVTQRSNVVQQAVRQAAGDMRLMNPVSFVENHSACRTNRAGQRVLPNGQVWKPHLLLLSFASKILAEANTLLKLQDGPPGKPFAMRQKAPPLPFLLSSLLQSRPQLKLPEEQAGDEDELEDELEDSSDSDNEGDSYDDLPPFKPLTKIQLAKLSKSQKKAYYDEVDYREKLYMKKQLKEERKRRRLMKKMAASAKDMPLPPDYNENIEEESGGGASVPVPMPDHPLPSSFDSDNPVHRYRFLDNSSQWLVRPVLESHGWDHDVGYEGINAERTFVVKEKVPVSFSGQVTKDKKEASLQVELASSLRHGEGKSTSVGFDMQTLGKEMAYTLRSETRFSNFRRNKTAAGLSVTYLGDALTAGVKIEDKLIINKRLRMVLTGGAMTGRGDVAYGGSLEATLRDKNHPLGRTLTTLGLSIMDWHGDLAIGANLQSQIPVGRTSNVVARANLNNRGAGQLSIRLNSSEQLQIALIALLPIFRKIQAQYQQMMFGE